MIVADRAGAQIDPPPDSAVQWITDGSYSVNSPAPVVMDVRSVRFYRREWGATEWTFYNAVDVGPNDTHVFELEDEPDGYWEWSLVVVDKAGNESGHGVADDVAGLDSTPPPTIKPFIISQRIDVDGDGIVGATDVFLVFYAALGARPVLPGA